MEEKSCFQCGNKFYRYPSQCVGRVFCTKKCSDLFKKGKPKSEETRKKFLGRVPWDKGIKIDRNKYPRMGHLKKHSEESNRKNSVAHLGRKTWQKGLTKETDPRLCSGARHHRWKGGVTKRKEYLRKTDNYKEWRMSVFSRDNFTCQKCHKTKTYLEAHHKEPVSQNIERIFDISNGVTLCRKCHSETDIYRNRFNLGG